MEDQLTAKYHSKMMCYLASEREVTLKEILCYWIDSSLPSVELKKNLFPGQLECHIYLKNQLQSSTFIYNKNWQSLLYSL